MSILESSALSFSQLFIITFSKTSLESISSCFQDRKFTSTSWSSLRAFNMARSLFNYLRSTPQPVQPQNEPAPFRALPSNWYNSREMYELERRSIFSRKWQLITHQNRLKLPGEWLKFDAAGYEFVLCRNRQGSITGFHNICRHRAFPVVTEAKGCSQIFSCKYHGVRISWVEHYVRHN